MFLGTPMKGMATEKECPLLPILMFLPHIHHSMHSSLFSLPSVLFCSIPHVGSGLPFTPTPSITLSHTIYVNSPSCSLSMCKSLT